MFARICGLGRARLSDSVSVARLQPGIADLERLRRDGFRAVLDLRDVSENAGPMPPEREAQAAAAQALAYAHVPVPVAAVNDGLLDRVGGELKRLPKPVLVHCTAGRRAGMFALAHVALEAGMSGGTMLKMARRLGFLYGSRNLQAVFADYVNRRGAPVDPLRQRADVLHEPAPVADEMTATGEAPVKRAPFRPLRLAPEMDRGAAPRHPAVSALALVLGGAVVGMMLDRRLLLVSVLVAGWLAQRALAVRLPALAAIPPAVAPDEVEALFHRLRRLREAA